MSSCSGIVIGRPVEARDRDATDLRHWACRCRWRARSWRQPARIPALGHAGRLVLEGRLRRQAGQVELVAVGADLDRGPAAAVQRRQSRGRVIEGAEHVAAEVPVAGRPPRLLAVVEPAIREIGLGPGDAVAVVAVERLADEGWRAWPPRSSRGGSRAVRGGRDYRQQPGRPSRERPSVWRSSSRRLRSRGWRNCSLRVRYRPIVANAGRALAAEVGAAADNKQWTQARDCS